MKSESAPPSDLKIFPDKNGCFRIPNDDSRISQSQFLEKISSREVIVVGIFGKTQLFDNDFKKGFLFDDLMQKDVFRIADSCDDSDSATIFGFHDERSNRIFLHLSAPTFDSQALARDVVETEEDIHLILSKKECRDLKLLLFMFHVCHLMICYHPRHTIDLSYIPVFQTLDVIRSKLHSVFGDYLQSKKVDLCREWLMHGRICQPKMIFYFDTCPPALRGSKGTSDLIKRDGTVSKHIPIRKLEFSLEDQLFKILKKAKVVSNTSINCLFSLPPRDGFVYVNNQISRNSTSSLIKHLLGTFDGKFSVGEDDGPFVPFFYSQSILDSRSGARCFESFLSTHLDSILSKATESERDGVHSRDNFELPKSGQWYAGAAALFPVFGSKPDSFAEIGILSKSETLTRSSNMLTALTDIETRFSEYRCAKVLPLAIANYKEGLQSHYIEEYHSAKLMQAMAYYSMHARGPASAKYAEMLVAECRDYWMAGRQMCEERSLTGHHCINRKHVTSESQNEESHEEKRMKKILPVMGHTSGKIFVSACNCGKRQGDREDPFTLIDANKTFYSEIAEDCCDGLERIEVPVFQQSALNLSTSSEVSKSDELPTRDVKDRLQNLATKASKPLVPVSRQPLQTMLTDLSKPGDLPLFASWALTLIGSSHLYNHSSGVNQPGFMSGTKVLHSWDVPLKNIDWKTLQEKWPNIADYAIKKPNFNMQAKGLEMGLTVKIFLGPEYECPRGHRFIAATPERSVKTKSSSSATGGSRMASSDLPLYMTCPCRASTSNRPLVAQLMRLHVVTPKGPIHVTLSPVVLPAPGAPKFLPGWERPVKLPISTYWVLRLPFIYEGENGPYAPPAEVPSLSYGKLLKGFIGVSEDYEYN